MEDEGGDGGGSSAAAARGRVITQAVKKGLIQNTIPIFIELKRLLESKNSPLTGSLMECLRIILKDYKNEIDDILVADKQLQKELIYDIQKYELNKAKSSAAEAVETMQKPDMYRSPCVVRKCQADPRVASAVADVVAEATARSVLKEVNMSLRSPPLSAMGLPRVKSNMGGVVSGGQKPAEVLESLRRREFFDSDEEN